MMVSCLFFYNDTATTEIYTLSLHDALPIWGRGACASPSGWGRSGRSAEGPAAGMGGGLDGLPAGSHVGGVAGAAAERRDWESTRLNSSQAHNSSAVFRLEKKKMRLLSVRSQ